MLVEGVQPCLIKSNDVKVFYFCKCYQLINLGGSDWTLAESTLSVFGCRCGSGGGSGCGSGGGRGGRGGDDGVCGGGDGGGGGGGDGGGGHDGGGDFGRKECFYGLFKGFLLKVGCLPHFPTRRAGTFWSRNAPVLLYTTTGTKYPSTLTIQMQTIFKKVGIFIK